MKELIEQLLHEKPFRMIRVVMRNGERFEIVDRLRVALGWKRLFVLLPGKSAHVKYDDIELVYQPREGRH